MLTGIALILIAVYVAMPKAIMITLIVFGSIQIALHMVYIVLKKILRALERIAKEIDE